MYNTSKEMINFHNDRVVLPGSTQSKLRGNRDANQERLKSGLSKNGDPAPQKFVKQGSYAMKTMVQHATNDYDIDDGVVFNKEDLVGPKGVAKTALAARKMVCDALQDKTFNTPPEVRNHCVRVYYNEGHHVDIPVYQQAKADESTIYELASSDWRKSNPEGVTDWFIGQCKTKHPQETQDYQLRRMIRLLKFFGRSRDSWNMPSGFIWTVLASEAFSWPNDDREDQVLRDIMLSIRNRLRFNKQVRHPVVDEYITKTEVDACMSECENRLADALKDLDILDSPSCTRSKALKAWKKVFNTDYFDDAIKKAENDEEEKAKALVASIPSSRPSPWSRS